MSSTLGEEVYPIVRFKMLVIATVFVHEISLANQYFTVRFWGGGMGYVKRVLSVWMVPKDKGLVNFCDITCRSRRGV